MNDQNFMLYALALVALIAGVLIVKKVASCLIKAIVLIVVVAIAAYVYYASNMQ